MISIDYKQLAQVIHQKKINFIASAITPWHAHGIDACIRKLQTDGIIVKGIILIKTNLSDSGYIIDEHHFLQTECDVYKFQPTPINISLKGIWSRVMDIFERIYNFFVELFSEHYNKNTIFVASPWNPYIKLGSIVKRNISKSNIVYCIFDEGLATYFPTSGNLISSITSIYKNQNLIFQIGGAFLQFLNRWIIASTKKWGNVINLNLLIQDKKQYKLNPVSSLYYKQVLKESAKKISNDVNLNQFDNSVIICTMPYKRSGISNMADIKLLKNLIDLLKEEGLQVIIKPHPSESDYAERYCSLKCEIFDNINISLESILSSSKNIIAVISFSSTSLVTSKLLFGIKVISIINLLQLSDFSLEYQNMMISFSKVFGNIIDIPSSFKQFREIVRTK